MFFVLQSEFATWWYQAVAAKSQLTTTSPPPWVTSLENIADRLPVITRGSPAQNMLASDIALVTATDFPAGAYQL